MSLVIDLSKKTACITGAANGIGAKLVKAFLDAGANVAALDIDAVSIENNFSEYAAERELTLQYYIVDTSIRSQVTDVVQKISHTFTTIDILINNVGISIVKPFLQLTENEWDRVFNINVKSAFHCCQEILPSMLANNQGCIINIASELAYLGRAEFVPYTASKGAIVTMTRSLAKEFAPTIRINGIAPGPCDTRMLRSEITTQAQLEKELDLPLGRFADPEEIATTAVFLASEFASYYCGDILSPNGGSLMR